jgi:putative ABC transport system permease protein
MIARAILRFLARTPWSTAMALIGMALGVTSIVSVHLVSASISNRLDGLVPSTLASYSHYLHRDELDSADYFALRRLWRAGDLPALKQLAPLVDETSQIDGRSVRVLGTDLLANLPSANTNTLVGPFSWNGVWVDESLKDQLSMPINGIIDAPKGTLLADIATAHDLLGWPNNQLSYIGLVLNDPFAGSIEIAEKLLPGFGAGFPSAKPSLDLPPDWQLVSNAEQYPAREFGKSILFNISALGMLALLVAWLLIYQVAVSWLRRLWPVFDRLHVLGVEWQQLRSYFLFSIGLVASLAALLGLAVGWWLAIWLLQMSMPGQAVNLSLDSWVIFKAVGSSVAVCLLGGAWAFHRSQRTVSHSTLPISTTLILLVTATWCVLQPQTGLAGGFFAIAVLSLAASQTIAPLLIGLKRWASMIRGSYLMRIGVREALWHPRELSVAIAGLSLAIATAIGVALMVDSFRVDFSQMLDHRLKYDVIAQGDAATLNKIAAKNEVARLYDRKQIYRTTDIRVAGLLMQLDITRMDAFESSRYGYSRNLATNDILVSEQAGRALQLSVGEQLTVAGEVMTVAGLFSAFGDLKPRIIVDQHSPLTTAFGAGLKTKTNNRLQIDSIAFSSDQPDALLTDLRQRFPKLELRLQSDIRRVALDTFDQTFAITTVLITIALLVAAISVYIAVTTMRLNRKTGRQLLNTLGVNRTEQLMMNTALGTGLGLVAIIIALPLGVMFGWILCNVINPRAFGWTIELQLSARALLYACGWGMLAAIAAGILQGGGREEGAFGER